MNLKFSIDEKTVQEFKEALRRKRDKVYKRCSLAIQKITMKLEASISEKIAEENSDTGRYLQSVEYTHSGLRGEVFTDAEYAPFVEEGTRPHRPPFLPLYEWVWRKRQDMGIKDEEVYPVAKGVVDKIAKYGTKAKKHWERSIKELNPEFLEVVKKAIKEGLNE